eukprot:gene30503-36865_t
MIAVCCCCSCGQQFDSKNIPVGEPLGEPCTPKHLGPFDLIQNQQDQVVTAEDGEDAIVRAGPIAYSEDQNFVQPRILLTRQIQHCIGKLEVSGGLDSYCAGYLTLCQSSGYGKTRLVKELSQDFILIYICLRPSAWDGWPKRSPVIADYIQKLTTDGQWEAFLTHMYSYLESVLPRSEKGKLSLPDWGGRFVSDAAADREFQESFWRGYVTFLSSSVKPKGNKLPQWLKNNKTRVLLAIDEASALLRPSTDFFLAFRRALRNVQSRQQTCIMFALVVDTNSALSNFSPVKHRDPSSRVNKGKQELFYPYYSFPVHVKDLIPTAIDESCQLLLIQSVPSLDINSDLITDCSYIWKPLKLLTQSRPMFACRALPIAQHYSDLDLDELALHLQRATQLALSKLVTNNVISADDDQSLVDLAHLATLACRCNLFVVNHVSKVELVRLFMASLVYVDDGRSNIEIRYPSEPCLVAGAMLFTQREDTFLQVLSSVEALYFHKKILVSNGGIGEVGKFLAQVVLLRAFDRSWMHYVNQNSRCSITRFRSGKVEDMPSASENDYQEKNDEFSPMPPAFNSVGWRPVPLLVFLQQLFDPRVYRKIYETISSTDFWQEDGFNGLERALVFCTHFVYVEDYEVTREDLQGFLERGAAAVCKQREVGVDIIIPVVLPRRRDVPINLSDADTFVLTAILIQVKSDKKAINPSALLTPAMDCPLARELVEAEVPLLFLPWNIKGSIASEACAWASVAFSSSGHPVVGTMHGKTRNSQGASQSKVLTLALTGLDCPCLSDAAKSKLRDMREAEQSLAMRLLPKLTACTGVTLDAAAMMQDLIPLSSKGVMKAGNKGMSQLEKELVEQVATLSVSRNDNSSHLSLGLSTLR